MTTTSVPQVAFTPTGVVLPTQPDILTGVQADINGAFGGNLDPSLSTPQGQIASSEAAIIADKNAQIAYLVNQFDPDYSAGRFQDALGKIYFLTRNPAESTVVQCVCIGLSGVVIPVGARAKATDGNIYVCTQAGTIPPSGTITLQFACQVTGPIAAPANSVNTIYQSIPGWDSINNPSDGTEGADVETRSQFEARRKASVAGNGNAIIQSIQAAVLQVAGVLDAYSYDNSSSSPVTVGGVTIGANSIYVCVSGGDSQDIANAIFSKKSPGCGYTGGTSVTVYDSNSGYSMPYPAYTVKYQTPTPLPFLFAINITNSAQVPANALAMIQTAIQNAFSGADGGVRARIGSTVYASRFYSAVASLGAWAQIISLQLGSTNAASGVIVGSISGTTLTVGSVTSGAVAIGQTLFDTTGAIIPGTTITAGSGTSWTVSVSQTVAGETITLCVADQNSQQADIDQVPTLSSSNIVLTLT